MNAALQGLGAGISLLAIAPWLYCQERARLTEYGIVHVVVAADSQHFAAATNRHRVIVWRTQDFKLERTFQHEKRIIQLAFSGDSKSLVLATRDFGTEPTDPCQVEWYDIAGDKMTKTKVVPGFVHTLGRDRFAALTVPPQRDRVTIHNLDTGENHKIELGADYEKIAFSPNGSLLATLDQGRGLVRLWDTKSGKLRTILDPGSQTYEFVFPADSKRLFTYRGANLWSWLAGLCVVLALGVVIVGGAFLATKQLSRGDDSVQ